jgi:hypothetical protein
MLKSGNCNYDKYDEKVNCEKGILINKTKKCNLKLRTCQLIRKAKCWSS